jgi:hypothetical protein
MTMSLTDHSDTRVNATRFIHTSKEHLEVKEGTYHRVSCLLAGHCSSPVLHGWSPAKQLVPYS